MTQLKSAANSPVFWGWLSMSSRALIPILGIYYSSVYLTDNASLIFWYSLTIFAIVGLFDLGFTSTFTRYFALFGFSDGKKIIDTEGKKVSTLLNLQDIVYRKLVSLFIIFSFFIFGNLLWPLSSSEFNNNIQAIFSIFFVCAGASFTLFSAKYRAVISGFGHIKEQKIIEAIIGIGTSIIFFILLDASLTIIFGSFFIFRFLELILLRRRANKYLERFYPFYSNQIEDSLKKEVYEASFKSGLGVLATTGTIEGCALLSGFLFDSGTAADYIAAQRFVLMLSAFSNLPFQVEIPKLVVRYKYGDYNSVVLRAKFLSRIVFFLLFSGGAITFYGLNFGSYFTSFENPFDNHLWWSLILYALLERAGAINVQLQTFNRIVNWHKSNGITGLLIVILVIPLSNLYGPVGFAYSFILGYLIVYLPYSIFLKKSAYPNISIIDELKTVLPFLIFAVFLMF